MKAPFDNIPNLGTAESLVEAKDKYGCTIVIPVAFTDDVPYRSEELKAYLASQPDPVEETPPPRYA